MFPQIKNQSIDPIHEPEYNLLTHLIAYETIEITQPAAHQSYTRTVGRTLAGKSRLQLQSKNI